MVNTLYAKINHPDSPDAQKFFFRFPNTDSEIGRLLQTLELPETGKEKNCAMHEPSIFGKSFPMLEGKRCNLDEVNYLAKRLACIDRNATTLFLAVAEATHADDVEKLIQLTFNTACYSVVNQFDDMTSLGKQLYLSEHPTADSHKVQDYPQYAMEVLARPPLAATQYGIVFQSDRPLQQVYNGQQFPQCQYDLKTAALLTIHSNHCGGTEYVYLPCEEIALSKALVRLNEDSLKRCDYTLENNSLPQAACNLFTGSNQPDESFSDLNMLANHMAVLSDGQCAKFLALCAWAKPTRLSDFSALCENHYEFQFVPEATNLHEYGKKLILESWKLADPSVLPYIDFEGYAKERQASFRGQFTEYGLLKYVGSSPEIAQIAKLPFEPPHYTTLRLFSPVHCDFYENDRYGEPIDNADVLSAAASVEFADSIEEMVEAHNQGYEPRGLAPYLRDDRLADKVYSMIPTVEEYGGMLFGVLECRLREPLTDAEYATLCEEWERQASDGYGEGLEQQEIKIEDGILFVHLWDGGSKWSIQTEAQLKGEPEQGFTMQQQ